MPDQSQSFLGKGWAFPIKPDPAGRLPYTAGEQKIRQSIWLILSTAPGERQMLPEFGCGIHDLLFQSNTANLRGSVQERVQDALLRWEPRIDVIDVRVQTPPDSRNELLIDITYRIRANNALHNLVYPFFINEGVR